MKNKADSLFSKQLIKLNNFIIFFKFRSLNYVIKHIMFVLVTNCKDRIVRTKTANNANMMHDDDDDGLYTNDKFCR